MLIGANTGFVQQYRFAASEAADDAFRSKVISLVLAGGVVSGLFGPETAKWSSDLFAPVMFAGCYAIIAALLACCGINLLGVGELNFWSALVLLGIGWNFLFVGAPTLLTRSYDPRETAKVQAFNDFLMFGTVALSSFSSGTLLTGFGWSMVQLAVLLSS
jgi:hypothetical protein